MFQFSWKMTGLPFAAACIFVAASSTELAAQSTLNSPPNSSASAAPESPTNFAALAAIAAQLSPAQIAKSEEIFSLAFKLWQSGDCDSAVIAFKQGLEIYPSNGAANYYMGNCLLKSDKKAEARIYLRRSIVFSSGSIEGFKAQSDLEKSSKVPTSLSEASDQDLLDIFPGKWVFSVGGGGGQFVMEREGDHVNILGKWKELFGGCKMHGKLVGKNLTMSCDGQAAFTGHAVTLTTFEGSWVGYNWTLSKQ